MEKSSLSARNLQTSCLVHLHRSAMSSALDSHTIKALLLNQSEDKDNFAYEVTIFESATIKEESIYEDMINKIKDDSEFEYVKSMIDYLVIHRMVTKREAELCAHFIYDLYNSRSLSVKERTRLIRSVFITLSRTRTRSSE